MTFYRLDNRRSMHVVPWGTMHGDETKDRL